MRSNKKRLWPDMALSFTCSVSDTHPELSAMATYAAVMNSLPKNK